MTSYDYCIIGAGPNGLTLALYLAKEGKKVVIVDKQKNIGGCHTVERISSQKSDIGFFTEHGPRIYLNNFLNFMTVLTDIDTSFDELFTKYHFNITEIGGSTLSNITLMDHIKLAYQFLLINENQKKVVLEDYLINNNFDKKSIDYIDRLCRMTDGAGINKFTLYNFLQIPNQNAFYTTYQPKLPNDHMNGLFGKWLQSLVKNGVDIILETEVIKLINNSDTKTIKSAVTDKGEIIANYFIMAIPPQSFNKIATKNDIKLFNMNNYNEWLVETNYDMYIPVIFHWNSKLDLPKIWGFPKTEWGLAFIVLSDYMEFDNPESKTVISAVISRNDKSTYTNKTPNETNTKSGIINEAFRQLKISYPNIPQPDNSFMTQNYRKDDMWVGINTAFMGTVHGYLPQTTLYKNLYNCGTHNGYSEYSFTSIESAVVNSFELLNKLTNKEFLIKKPNTVRSLVLILLAFIIIYFIANK